MPRAPRGMGSPVTPAPTSAQSPAPSKDASLTTAFASGVRDGALGSLRSPQAPSTTTARPAQTDLSEAPVGTKTDSSPVVTQETAPLQQPQPAPPMKSPAKPNISAYQRAREQLDQKLEARGFNDPTRTAEIDFSR